MAKRQTLIFKSEYLKYNFIQEINKLWNTFADEEIIENSKNYSFYIPSKYIISSMEEGMNKKYHYNFNSYPEKINGEENKNNFILCCISGGKDSLATAIYYKEQGYNIQLYTVRGINRGYPEEYKAAINLAEKMNIPIYVDEIKMTGKKFFMEHPLKNQVIASMAIAYCLENNLSPKIAFGNYQEDTNTRSKWGVNWTDNFELWKYFNLYIKDFVEEAEIFVPFYSDNESLKILTNHFNLVPLYQSCLITVRNREQLRLHNQEKYKIKIFPNRCGSCRKCCMEYVYFCDIGKLEYNKDYYKHCLEILKKKYEEYTGRNKQFKNLQEVHDTYFPNLKSKYFNET